MAGYIARLLRRTRRAARHPVPRLRPSRNREAVTVVSDGAVIRAGIDSAGDEPLMLARALPGVIVVVGATAIARVVSRKSSWARPSMCWTTGFSICSLRGRSICCWSAEDDLSDLPLPAGRLREPLTAGSGG